MKINFDKPFCFWGWSFNICLTDSYYFMLICIMILVLHFIDFKLSLTMNFIVVHSQLYIKKVGEVCENYNSNKCPSGTSYAVNAPSFVGTDYYYESSNPSSY